MEKAARRSKFNMTEGTEWKLILSFAIPIILGNMLQQLYNTVDGIVVGNYVNSNALAAIGTCSTLARFFLCFSMGFSNGCGVIVSQLYGARHEAEIKKAFTTGMMISLGLGVALSAFGLICHKWILATLMNISDPDVFGYARLECAAGGRPSAWKSCAGKSFPCLGMASGPFLPTVPMTGTRKAAGGFFCGPAELDACYLYGVSFCQMRFADDAQREQCDPPYDGIDAASSGAGSAEPASARFLEWCAGLPDRKPIVLMSHMPLHANRPDNRGAAVWCAALNEAAERRDVFVFFAHNHSSEHKSGTDRRYYYVPAGGMLPVQGREKEARAAAPIRFHYLNAGYVLNGCGTLLRFDGNTVTVRRYAPTDAETAFGDTGYRSPLS